MIVTRALQRPPALVAVVLVAVGLIVGIILRPGDADSFVEESFEPYAPFRMTYMQFFKDSHTNNITTTTSVLTWHSLLHWRVDVLDSTYDPTIIGSYDEYEHGVYTSYSSRRNDIITSYGADGSDNTYEVPKPWLFPDAYLAEDGWTTLGLQADGYEHFQRTLGPASGRYIEIYKRDPVTLLVMEVEHKEGAESFISATVLSYERLSME